MSERDRLREAVARAIATKLDGFGSNWRIWLGEADAALAAMVVHVRGMEAEAQKPSDMRLVLGQAAAARGCRLETWQDGAWSPATPEQYAAHSGLARVTCGPSQPPAEPPTDLDAPGPCGWSGTDFYARDDEP